MRPYKHLSIRREREKKLYLMHGQAKKFSANSKELKQITNNYKPRVSKGTVKPATIFTFKGTKRISQSTKKMRKKKDTV